MHQGFSAFAVLLLPHDNFSPAPLFLSASWPKNLLALLLIFLAAGLAVFGSRGLAFDFTRVQAAYLHYRSDNLRPLRSWQDMLQQSRALPANEQLRRVNEFFNRQIRFDEDQSIWGRSDYWATPLETLAKGAGDCEDFVIAKYFSLLALGMPSEQLRLIYVKARIGGPASAIQQAHMVLAYYPTPEAEPQVLDNLITDIRPASRRPDLQPVFSFNSNGVYAGISGKAAAGPGGPSRLSKWQDLLVRVRNDGFE